TLQQILFFKELGFPLQRIKEIINQPTFDRLEALEMQRKMLLEKRRQLGHMLETIDNTVKDLKGEIKMSNKGKFKGFD
ncbi:MerR family DNA-binding protein, partial [Pseudomonas sp. 2822-17]|uniref:MerR family DNA-binding protein n=1 Tax=Pseudomonas sp. 2822-17 TaxID=1712678 RepID=UPI000C690A5B